MIPQKGNCSQHLHDGNDGILWMWKTLILIQTSHSIRFFSVIIAPFVTCNSGNTYMPIYLYCSWVCLPSLVFFLHTGLKNYKTMWKCENVWGEATTSGRQNACTGVSKSYHRSSCHCQNVLFLFKSPQRTW